MKLGRSMSKAMRKTPDAPNAARLSTRGDVRIGDGPGPRVVHFSTLHSPQDVRIFYKECRTLAAAGYEVHMLVPGALAGEQDSVILHPLPGSGEGHPLLRALRRVARAYREAARLDADVYHFHDPELIPAGVLLKLRRARVVYDVHEDGPKQALSLLADRPWWGRFKAFVRIVLDRIAVWMLDGFVCATPVIAESFPPNRSVIVQNFPLLSEFAGDRQESAGPTYDARPPTVVYVGSLFVVRGVREMVEAMGLLPETLGATLRIAGTFSSAELRAHVEAAPGWSRVEYLGWQKRDQVVRLLGSARIGLVLLHRTPAYLDSYPIKLFEYMAAGIPVIASNFPLWRRIVERTGSGLLVDPLDPRAIEQAIRFLLEHPSDAEAMGRRGRAAVLRSYRWDREAERLLSLYSRLAGYPAAPSMTTVQST